MADSILKRGHYIDKKELKVLASKIPLSNKPISNQSQESSSNDNERLQRTIVVKLKGNLFDGDAVYTTYFETLGGEVEEIVPNLSKGLVYVTFKQRSGKMFKKMCLALLLICITIAEIAQYLKRWFH